MAESTSTKVKAGRIAAGSGAILSLGASLVATAGPAGAATFNVTTTADAGPGSLRQAIADANANPGADTITFAAALGSINLTGGDIDITDDLVITDPEADVTIDGNSNDRIFYIGNAGAVTLSGLTLQNGATGSSAGAVSSRNTDLTVTDSTVTGNTANGSGGGIHVYGGSLSVTGSTFRGNTSTNAGGGIMARRLGAVSVTNSSFVGNTTSGDGGGLHVDEASSVTISDSTFESNYATSDGGGISIYDFAGTTETVTVTGVTATGNAVPDQAGGMAIQGLDNATVLVADSTFTDNDGFNGGGVTVAFSEVGLDVTIQGSTFTRNHAHEGEGGGAGGGLYLGELDNATVLIDTSTFEYNRADSYGGGIAADHVATVTVNASTISNNVSEGFGGGIAGIFADLTVTNSTLSGNESEVGGGIAFYSRYDSLEVSHSTITGNTAEEGGGLFLGGYGGAATLDHNIIDGNIATGGGAQPVVAPAGEPVFDQYGGAIFVTEPRQRLEELQPQALDSVTLTNNLVNGTIAGVLVDGGGNLFEEPANLGPLADNGGPTLTHNLLAGSAALDAGSAAFAPPPSTDQRGLPRVSNGTIDMGAVEVQVQEPVEPPVVPPAEPVPADPTFTG